MLKGVPSRRGFVVAVASVTMSSNFLGAVFVILLAPVMMLAEDRALYLETLARLGPAGQLLNYVGFLVLGILLPLTWRASRAIGVRGAGAPVGERDAARLLDLPFRLSLYGIGGWVLSFAVQLCAVAAVFDGARALQFFRTLPMNLVAGGISFVFAYYVLEALSRRRWIPFALPGGRLSGLPALRLPVRTRFRLLYAAIAFNRS